MAVETGRFISDLIESNPSGAEYLSQGDNHIRLIKTCLKATFPFSTIGSGIMYSNGGSSAVSIATASQLVSAIGSSSVGKATSLAGGSAGTVVYQAAPGVSSFATVGTGLRLTGGVLESTFTATPYTLTGAVEELYTATAGQTVFSIAETYTPGAGQLAVFRNGQRLSLTEDYVETNTTTVTLTSGVDAGDKMVFIIGGYEAGLPQITARKVVIIGDSTTVNIPNGMPSWPEHFERTMQHYRGKCDVVTLAAGALTAYRAQTLDYYEGRTVLGQCIAEVPDLVIIQLGAVEGLLNPDSRTIAQRKQDMVDLVNAIHAGVPSAKIVYSSQRCYDNVNFTPATLKNKGIMPWFFALKSTGIETNAYCSAMLEDSVSAGTISAVNDWVDWDTNTKAIANLSGWYTADYWRIARLGCTGSDGLHLSHYGHIMLSAYAVKGLRSQTWFTSLFPNFVADSLHAGEDPDELFSATLTSSGSGYTWTQTGVGEDVSKGFGKMRMFFPGAWYLPSKGNAIVHTTPIYNEQSSLIFGLNGGLPVTAVELSTDGAAFTSTKFATSEAGDALVILNPLEYSAGSHTYRLRTGNEIYGPYSLTVTNAVMPCVIARVSSSGQAISADTNTQIIFQQEILDTHNNFNTGTGIFTCSKAGKYLAILQVKCASLPVNAYIGAALTKNGSLTGGDVGSSESISDSNGANVGPMSTQVSVIFDLVVGDIIRSTVWCNVSTTIDKGAGANSGGTMLSIRWLGY